MAKRDSGYWKVALVLITSAIVLTLAIHNIQQIDRGYENIESKLQALGAQIERVY